MTAFRMNIRRVGWSNATMNRGVLSGVAVAAIVLFSGPVRAADLGDDAAPPAETDRAFDVRRDATVAAVERVLPSVVNVASRTLVDDTSAYERFIEEFYGHRHTPSERYSRGSGVVISEDGYVLTNVHVVGDATDILVNFYNETNAIPAERVAVSAAKDVALLRLKPKTPRKFRPVKFAKDDDLLLGETVIALGNPFGLGGSISKGILSSKSRRPAWASQGDKLDIKDWLQTDAAINPGNSGGPLVNLRGELIGLNVAILNPATGAQGIGFAIPIKRVNEALAEVLSGESVGQADQRLWLGARLQPLLRPLTISAVQEGSPAESAGLKPMDVILSVDGNPPGSLIDFNRALVAAGAERDIELTVRRSGQSRKVVLRLVLEKSVFNNDLIRRRIGLTLRPLEGGFAIASVDRNGPAAKSGLEPGMMIEAIDGQPADDVTAAAKLVSAKPPGELLPLDLVIVEQRGFMRRVSRGSVKLRLK
jgi:serine protease Do